MTPARPAITNALVLNVQCDIREKEREKPLVFSLVRFGSYCLARFCRSFTVALCLYTNTWVWPNDLLFCHGTFKGFSITACSGFFTPPTRLFVGFTECGNLKTINTSIFVYLFYFILLPEDHHTYNTTKTF